MIGGQLITGFNRAPGDGGQTCTRVSGLGNPFVNGIQIPKISINTPAGGTAGGTLRLVEETPLGSCELLLDLSPGMDGEAVVQAVVDAMQAPGIPGPHPGCPSARNPRDLSAHGAALISVHATSLEFCTDDSRLGFDLRPEELFESHPAADAGPDRSVNHSLVTLDGTGSSDPDSTVGTSDDIVGYRWERLNGGVELLGAGATLDTDLADGDHRIRLTVTDRAGLQGSDEALIRVESTTPLALRPGAGPVLSLHAGLAAPVGDFAGDYDAGLSLALDIEHAVGAKTTLLGWLQHHRFDGDPGIADERLTTLHLNLRRYLRTRQWPVYVQGGLGMYYADVADDDPGINVGIGAHWPLNSSTAFEAGFDVHWVNPGGSNDRWFLQPTLGLKFAF